MAKSSIKNPEKQEDSSDSAQYDKADWWIRRAKATEKIFEKRNWEAAKQAWGEYDLGTYSKYASQEGTGASAGTPRAFNIFYSSVKTIAPAYYSKTPIPVGKARHMADVGARTGCKIYEAVGNVALETTPFDEVMYDEVMELILSDAAVPRVVLEGKEVKTVTQVPIAMVAENQFVLQDGAPYTGTNVGQDPNTGQWFGESEVISYEDLKCYPKAMAHRDVMWTPEATSFDEVNEMYYRFCYPEDQAYEMFPEIDPKELKRAMKPYGVGSDKEQGRDAKEIGSKEWFLHGWEIWHKVTKKVRFVSPLYRDDFLKQTDDKYRLRGFFPSPSPIIGTKQYKSMFGRPAFCYLTDLCDQMHEVALRIFALSKSMRRRFAVDSSLKGKLNHLIAGADESEYVFIDGLMGLVEKGGLMNAIQALPVDDLSRALTELANLHALYKQEFYEIYGVPDVLRGASDPLETAKAQEIKSFAASNRFRFQMNQVARMARDLLELLVDLKLGAYTKEQIAQMCGVQYWDDAQNFDAGYALCMDDGERTIRLDLETDSTSYINEQINQQNMNVAIQTVTGGLASVNQMPPLQQTIVFKTIQAALSGLRMGKEFQDDIDQLMQQMMDQANQPPPPPPPDYEMMKAQTAQQKVQLDAQFRSQELQQKNMEMQLKQQSEVAKAQVAALELQLKRQAQAFFEFTEQIRLGFESQGIEIDVSKFQLSAEETVMEEQRLAREVDVMTIEALKPPPAPEPSKGGSAPTNVTIINDGGKPAPEILPLPIF